MKILQIFNMISLRVGISDKAVFSMRTAITTPIITSARFNIILTSVLAILLFGSMSVQAQTIYYVRAGANGAKNGSDWNNAYDKLPASLSRGATYYIAGGNYGSYIFDDPVSGTQLITIKKATNSDHGTATGWSNSYGDGQQATFGELVFVTKYYTIDGSTRNENAWDSGIAYGFKIKNITGHSLNYAACGDFITIKYCDIGGDFSLSYNSGIPDAGLYLGGFNDLCENWTIQKNFIHNVGIVGQMNGVNNMLWEYNWLGLSWSKEIIRGQNTAKNVVIRYNTLKDGCRSDCNGCSEGCTADIGLFSNQGSNPDFNGFEAYGNLIWKTVGAVKCCGTIMAEVTSGGKIYNNTIVDNGPTGNPSSGRLRLFGAPGSEIKNNILYFPNGMGSGCEAETCSNNSTYTSSPPFVNSNAGNFQLSSDLPGESLVSTYKLDMVGNARGSDGKWDRGAFEYGAGSGGDSNQLSPPSAVRIKTP